MYKNESPRIVPAIGGMHKKYQTAVDNKSFKLLPPYGKEAVFLISQRARPRTNIFMFAGFDPWYKAKAFEMRKVILCLPYDENPSVYSWPVDDCPMIPIDTFFLSIIDADRITYCLLSANIPIVRTILFSFWSIVCRRSMNT
jgi:hypothetical protein